MLEEGLIITCMGMGTVLSFLCILVVSMLIIHKVLIFINKFFPILINRQNCPKTWYLERLRVLYFFVNKY